MRWSLRQVRKQVGGPSTLKRVLLKQFVHDHYPQECIRQGLIIVRVRCSGSDTRRQPSAAWLD
jgi:hypothetical protein